MPAPTISVEELKKKVKNVFLLDVRELDESGQIVGAIRVPLGKVMRDLPKLNLPADEEIVCYCAGGFRGQVAADFLAGKGFKARNLVGGYKAYMMASAE